MTANDICYYRGYGKKDDVPIAVVANVHKYNIGELTDEDGATFPLGSFYLSLDDKGIYGPMDTLEEALAAGKDNGVRTYVDASDDMQWHIQQQILSEIREGSEDK